MSLQNPQFFMLGNYVFSNPVPLESTYMGLGSGIFAGVYALYYLDLSGYHLRYIGQTGSFESRLDFNHHAVQKILQEPFSSQSQIYVAYHHESDVNRRKQIEQELIHAFQPKYNVQHAGLDALVRFLANQQY
jgi:hypothetical protein